MGKHLIELKDGIIVEVDEQLYDEFIEEKNKQHSEPEDVSFGESLLSPVNPVNSSATISIKSVKKNVTEQVDEYFDKIKDKIVKISKSFTDSWLEINQNQLKASTASVEFGFSFEGKGNIYLVEAKGNANIKVTINWDFDKLRATPKHENSKS